MPANNPDEISDPSTNKQQEKRRPNRWILAFSFITSVLFAGSLIWGYSERNRVKTLENELLDARSSTPIVQTTQSCEEIVKPTEQETANYSNGSELIISNFKAAFESGDYEQVRALFTDDGVLTTASNVHDAIMTDDTSHLADRVDEQEFIRLATIHGDRSQEFIILGDPLMIGDNTLAFAWEWGDGVNGTALLHLRNGKIVICILNPAQYQIPFTGK
ncbi:nuclear transport factor 2 family protein [Chloroflexota bacterium]|nr:nuclear transport factor 2 family protein [Chloroflexota bacterium]